MIIYSIGCIIVLIISIAFTYYYKKLTVGGLIEIIIATISSWFIVVFVVIAVIVKILFLIGEMWDKEIWSKK